MGRPMMEERIEPVDREKVCPMLLRIFCKFEDHHTDNSFTYKDQPLSDEVRVHTWRDATFGELAELLAQVTPFIRTSFAPPLLSLSPLTSLLLLSPSV